MSLTHVVAIAAVALVACAPAPAPAQNAVAGGRFADLYDDSELRYWQSRYEPNLRYNFDSLVMAALTPAERARVGAVRLNVPRRHLDDPLAFRADGPPPVITMSVGSIRFLDDIAIAMTWLNENRYSIESIAYYASVLKHRPPEELAGGRYPAPMAALGIPENALSNRRVDDASQKLLKTAIVYILAHEVGHVLRGHVTDTTIEQRQRQEVEADRFALDLFRRIGVPPLGTLTLFFLTTYLGSHPGDFESREEWMAHLRTTATHPLSSSRLRAVAAELRRRPSEFVHAEPRPDAALRGLGMVPMQLDSIAALLDDPQLGIHLRAVGMQIPMSELRPRRPGATWIPPRDW